jgi:hypothetical protein
MGGVYQKMFLSSNCQKIFVQVYNGDMDEGPRHVWQDGNLVDASAQFQLRGAERELQVAKEDFFRARDRLAKQKMKNNGQYLNQLASYLNDSHDARKMEILVELRRFRSSLVYRDVTSVAIEYEPTQELNTVLEYDLAEIGYLLMDPPSEDARKEAEIVVRKFFESPAFRKQGVAVIKDEKGGLRLTWDSVV